jgi:hypothetical protein
LASEGLDYVVIGAFALAVHGTVRATTDADALVRASAQRLKQAVPAFERAGLAAPFRQGDHDDPVPALLQLHDAHGNGVSLLAGLRGLDPGTFDRTLSVALRDGTLRIASREDFIAMNCFAGGAQDLEDARRACHHPGATVDLDRLWGATRHFGAAACQNLDAVLATPDPRPA